MGLFKNTDFSKFGDSFNEREENDSVHSSSSSHRESKHSALSNVGIKRTNIQKPPAIDLTESGKKASKKNQSEKVNTKVKKKYTKLEPVMLCDSVEDFERSGGNHLEKSEFFDHVNMNWDKVVAKPVISPMLNPLKKKQRNNFDDLESPVINAGFKILDQ